MSGTSAADRTELLELLQYPIPSGCGPVEWRVCHAAPALQYPLSEKVARAHQAVIVADAGTHLVIAVPEPNAPGLVALLSTAARRPVRLIAAGLQEITLALARCHQPDHVEVLRCKRFLNLITALELDYLLDDAACALLMRATVGSRGIVTAVAARLPDGWGPELLGLLDGLPHLPLTVAQFHAELCLLLPPALRGSQEARTLAPWRVVGETLLLACGARPGAAILASIEAWTGLRLACVVCDPEVVRTAASRRDISTAGRGAVASPARRRARRVDPLRAMRGAAVQAIRALRGDNDDSDQSHIVALAHQMGSSPEIVSRRLMARATVASRQPLHPSREALAVLPPRLARSLAVLPLRWRRTHLDVAMAMHRTDGEEISAVIALLTGRRVHVRWVAPAVLERALHDAYGPAAEEGSAQAPAAGGDVRHRARSLELSPDPAVTMALRGLPHIRLQHYAVMPMLVEGVPLARLRELRAVPVYREGHVLWVALAAPDERTVREVAQLTSLAVRPLLASPEAIEERLDVLDAVSHPDGQAQQRAHPVVQYLRAHGRLMQADLIDILDDTSRPVDQALDAAGVLDYREFAALAARLSGLPQMDLRLQQRSEEVFDAVGQPTSRLVWNDPVDPSVASLLPPETIEALGVLPVMRGPDASAGPGDKPILVFAVADPFAPDDDERLALLAEHRVRRVVAPRPTILTALARVRGEAPLGEHLLARGMLTAEELEQALRLHRTAGVRLGQALLNLNLVSQGQLAYVLAAQQNLPFVRLREMQPVADVAHLLSEEVERRLGVVPLYEAEDALVVATPDPLNRAMVDEVEARLGRRITLVVCTESDLEAILETLYRDEYLRRSSSDLVVRTPEESAHKVLSRNQKLFLGLAALTVIALLGRAPSAVGIGITAACSVFYAVFSLYRCYLIYRALAHNLEMSISPEELAAVNEASLPIYTILVPLYREASVLPILLAGLSRLDYPATKLDVKLLLEADDHETLAAVSATRLPSYVYPVIVPAARPRGKPKACNYGLIRARGEYVVIYDAEDVPDPDQLKKVVLAFRKVSPDVACIQAKLNYFNGNQNLLTNWFTTEYSMWFDLFLPGLDASGVPIPLGGTSNHFPTARLREAGAWDPYNVTEDADLGIRLFRRGWKTAVIDSTTYEEANSETYNWIRQRSRWVKGYIQTFLVHMRHPVQLWRALGAKAFSASPWSLAGRLRVSCSIPSFGV